MPKERVSRGAGSRSAKRSVPKAIHPGSRKAVQLLKEAHRQDKVQRKKVEKKAMISAKIGKLMWFREHVDESKTLYSCADMSQLIQRYIQRHDEELERIVGLQTGKSCMASSHRLQHASKEDSLRQIIHREQEQFHASGFEAPDLTNVKLFKNFLSWFGDERLLATIPLRKYVCVTDT